MHEGFHPACRHSRRAVYETFRVDIPDKRNPPMPRRRRDQIARGAWVDRAAHERLDCSCNGFALCGRRTFECKVGVRGDRHPRVTIQAIEPWHSP